MIRSVAALVALAAVTAGCIAAPQEGVEPAAAPPPPDRIEGVTLEQSHTDSIVPCDGGGITFPPGICAERVLVAEGRMGIDRLPVDLEGSNGDVVIVPSSGDAWSFQATIRVRALTEGQAREGLDTQWSWSHEDADGYAIHAGPVYRADPLGLTQRVVYTAYELTLPEWVVLDLDVETDNGGIVVEGFEMENANLETDNGGITVFGWVVSADISTDNGEIVATLRPVGSGEIEIETDNGEIVLALPEGRLHGYELEAETDNGEITIELREGDKKVGEEEATFRTRGFETRAHQTMVSLTTDNGGIFVGPA